MNIDLSHEKLIIRLWVTGLRPDRVADYDAFANSRSLAMFQALDGCEGVIFMRSDCRGYVFSFWRDLASIAALADSPIYLETVRDIVSAGFLAEPQTVELVDVTGTYLSEDAIRSLQASLLCHADQIKFVAFSSDRK